jgi:hypothetical protein
VASYRELIEIFTAPHRNRLETSRILSLFRAHAKAVQAGRSEHIPSRDWLNIWWPVNEHVFIQLFREDRALAFYQEAESALAGFLEERGARLPPGLLADAIRFNQAVLKRPFLRSDLELTLDYNVPEVYLRALNGDHAALQRGSFTYRIDRTSEKWSSWDAWCREVVWYGTKRGAYFYKWTRV